jgi:hypothetical protein
MRKPAPPNSSFSEEVVERFARAWASIDGRLEDFDRERKKALLPPEAWESEEWTGHYIGYMAEARELLERAGCYVSTRPPPQFVDHEAEQRVVSDSDLDLDLD